MKNIILIGMMGCGKTTAGHMLAQQLGRPFVDCDELMEGTTGRTISQIFAQDGERGFRSLESQVLEQLSSQEGLVIATGGGAVLSRKNVISLRRNGILVFLDRPIDEICASLDTEGRPLAQEGHHAFVERHHHRLPLYLSAADVIIQDFSTPEATVAEILEKISEVGKKFLIINGPNLNLLGKGDVELYGRENHENYASLCTMIQEYAKVHNSTATCFQSNHEGDLIDQIQAADGAYDAIIINPGAYAHYSYAILDALQAVNTPAFEVLIGNIHAREPFRSVSVTASGCVGQIYGLGLQGYLRAMDFFLKGGQ